MYAPICSFYLSRHLSRSFIVVLGPKKIALKSLNVALEAADDLQGPGFVLVVHVVRKKNPTLSGGLMSHTLKRVSRIFRCAGWREALHQSGRNLSFSVAFFFFLRRRRFQPSITRQR